MKTILLCGGKGTRYDITKPKSLVMIGNKSIIHHIMEIYSRQGYNDFILTLGWKGNLIKKYFNNISHSYNIEFVDTGEDSDTGERIRQIEPYIDDNEFFCTYSDGLANVNMDNLKNKFLSYQHFNISAMMTIVRPIDQFGVVDIDDEDFVSKFDEKPLSNNWINGGFFIFSKNIFKYIKKNESLENYVLPRLVKHKILATYKHETYWNTLNTPKDEIRLNKHAEYDDVLWYNL